MFRLFTVRDITPGAAPFCCCTPILHITLHDIALHFMILHYFP